LKTRTRTKERRAFQTAVRNGDIEALSGGVEKNRRTKRGRQEETPRTPEPQEAPEPQAPVAVLPAILQAAQPPEEKGVEMKTTTAVMAQATQARQEFKPCPLCGYAIATQNKTKEGGVKKYLVCKACNDKFMAYVREIAVKFLENPATVTMSKIEWVLSQLDLERFEKELEAARNDRDNIQAKIDEEVHRETGGKSLPREVFVEVRNKVGGKVRNENYFTIRHLNGRLQAAKALKAELEKLIADKAAEATADTAVPVTS